jgi:tryptophan synthase alpha chain
MPLSAIRETFDRLRRRGRAALIPFVMGGDPTLSLTGPLLLALQEAGADLVEVGIPFSDPLADGPVIQAASGRALARGATPAGVLAAVASVRSRLRIPVVYLSYWNPIVQFGGHARPGSPEPFLRAARGSGCSGVIVPDLPVEEGALLRQAADRAGLAAIFLAAPTSPPQRLRAIARASQGFIYYVSVTGTTGARRALPPGLAQGVRQLKLLTTKPVCVGFGISTPAQVAAVARLADGAIVGSALVRAIAGARGRAAALRTAAAFVTRLKRGLR